MICRVLLICFGHVFHKIKSNIDLFSQFLFFFFLVSNISIISLKSFPKSLFFLHTIIILHLDKDHIILSGITTNEGKKLYSGLCINPLMTKS